MPKYQLTIVADTLAELTGAVTEAAQHLQTGDTNQTVSAELAPLADPVPDNGALPLPLPLPEPDYAGAGLTAWQQIRAQQAQPEPIYVPPQAAVAVAPVPQAPQTYQAPAAPAGPPVCRLGHGPMVWKGGGLSKSGKGLPLWSCPDQNCREAVWPPRA